MRLKQPELASETLGIGCLEARAETVEYFIRVLNGSVLIFVKERQECFREPGEVPPGYARLVAISVAAELSMEL